MKYLNNEGKEVAPLENIHIWESYVPQFEDWKKDHPKAIIIDILYGRNVENESCVLIVYTEVEKEGSS